jgi:hypothetical protein
MQSTDGGNSMPNELEDVRVNLKGFFTKGFDSSEDYRDIKELNLPVKVKYMGHTADIETKFGPTNRFIYEDPEGEKYSHLCKGATFLKAIEQFVPVGTVILLFKNEKGYWEFDFPDPETPSA